MRKRTPGPELDYILRLQVTWSVDDIVAAIEHATKYGAFDGRSIECSGHLLHFQLFWI